MAVWVVRTGGPEISGKGETGCSAGSDVSHLACRLAGRCRAAPPRRYGRYVRSHAESRDRAAGDWRNQGAPWPLARANLEPPGCCGCGLGLPPLSPTRRHGDCVGLRAARADGVGIAHAA